MIILKSHIRFLLKNKLYAVITILGFSISLTVIFLLSTYIQHELSIDDFHENKDRIYRLESEHSYFPAPIAPELKTTYPEIEDYVRVYPGENIISIANNDKHLMKFLCADESFFSIFSFPILHGDPHHFLKNDHDIVLSLSFARKLFGTSNPIGQKIRIYNSIEFTVSGVMADMANNTHFKPIHAILPLKSAKLITGFNEILSSYDSCIMSIYLLGRENTNLTSKVPQILKAFEKDFWLYKEGYAKILELTPLKQVYFSDKRADGTKSNDKNFIIVLSIVVLLILLLSFANYINLTVALSTFRVKEIATKKLLGSSKKQMFFQFIKESLLICFLAMIVTLLLTKLALPVFNTLLKINIQFSEIITPMNLFQLSVFIVVLGIISGSIPAFKVMGINPLNVIKGSFRLKVKSSYSKVFITFQYTTTIVLLVCTWIIIKQTDFLRNFDLGFEKDNILKVEYLGSNDEKEEIRNVLKNIPGVKEVSLTWQSPLTGGSNQSFSYNDEQLSFQEFKVDSAFFSVFNISIKPTKVAYTETGVYLNSPAIKALGGTSDNIPESFVMHGETVPILGMINDFNFNNLKHKITPLMIGKLTKERFTSSIFIKINSNNQSETLTRIQQSYEELIDNAPFNLVFVSDTLNKWYEREERTGRLISYFTLLSFVIAFLGILTMSIFYMQQKTKEIGIRKVNGATINEIMLMLNKDFIKWVVIAFVIACPIAYYTMSKWLENFAYKTELSWWVFVLAGAFTLVIALLTVSWQTYRAAAQNPVESLRDE